MPPGIYSAASVNLRVNFGSPIVLGFDRTLFVGIFKDPLDYYLDLSSIETKFTFKKLFDPEKDWAGHGKGSSLL